MSHVDTGSPASHREPSPQPEAAQRRPIPTLYRLPWLVLGFAPWYLKHFFAQPYRRSTFRESMRELLCDPRRRHRIALYDGVLNIILNGYAALCRRPVNRRTGQMVVAFARLAFAFDDEYERRSVRGAPLPFDAVFGSAHLQQPLQEWRDLMRPMPAYPAIRSYLERFIRSLYADYVSENSRPPASDDFDRLVRAATLDSGGFLSTIAQIVALAQDAALDARANLQFTALGVLGKAADDMIDFRADGAGRRANLLCALIAEAPPEQQTVHAADRAGSRMNTVWWRRHCPSTFERYLAMCSERYIVLDTAWLRFACQLMWIPALLGRATTKDVRGRL